jgi:T-complex protein 1 subunit eta
MTSPSREPAIVKANAITAASEATCLLLSVDETVKNPRSGQGAEQGGGMGGMPGGMGRGRGRPM